MEEKVESSERESKKFAPKVIELFCFLNCLSNCKVKATKLDEEEVSERETADGEISFRSQCNFPNDDETVKVSQSVTSCTNKPYEKVTEGRGAVLLQGKHENRMTTVKRKPRINNQAGISSEIRLLTEMASCERSLQSCLRETSMSHNDILCQLANEVQFLHQRNILHLNLNPETVRVVEKNGKHQIKLTNFSRAVELTSDWKVDIDDFEGMKGFIAPELKFKHKASLSADVFSLGCLFFYVMAGGKTLRQVSKNGQEINIGLYKMPSTSDDALGVRLIKNMVKYHATQRLNIDEVVNDPFFWSTRKIFQLFLDVNKMFEDRAFKVAKKAIMEANKEKVIGSDWKLKLHADVQTSVKNYDGTSLLDLVRVIRNQYAHRRPDNLVDILGRTDEELKDYFIVKFPDLIHHLIRVMKLLA